jgi:hypothetical protein
LYATGSALPNITSKTFRPGLAIPPGSVIQCSVGPCQANPSNPACLQPADCYLIGVLEK